MVEVGTLTANLDLDGSGFSQGLDNMTAGLDGFKNTVAKVGDSLKALLANPVVLAAAAGAALFALGKAAYDAFVEIDAAYDKIETSTGAMGESLDSLKQSFDNVFSNATYVDDAETLATTISDLNTYLGLTGENLEIIATQVSNLQGMGKDISVESLSQAFNRWGVETEDMSKYLDYFYTLSQDTGIGIDELTDSLTGSQATLSLFGFSLEESANLLGQMKKSGYEVGELDTGLKQLVNSGITTRDAFEELIDSIQNAATEQDALTAAGDAFGARSKTAMVNLIRSGVFDDLSGSFEESIGAIEASAQSTEDFGDKMDRFGRQMTLVGAAAGSVIESILSALFDFSSWWFSIIGRLASPFVKLFERIGETFAKFWGEGEDTSKSAIDNIIGFIDLLVDAVVLGVDVFLDYVWPVIEGVVWAIVQLIKLFSAIFAGDWDNAFAIVLKLSITYMKALYAVLEAGWNAIMDGLQFVAQSIINFIFEVVNSIVDVVENGINMVIDALNSVARAANSMLGTDFELFQHVSLDIAAPTVPQLQRFADSGIGQWMQERIQIAEESVAAMRAETGVGGEKTVNVTQNVTINGDLQNDSQAYRELNKTAQRLGTAVNL